MIHHGGPYLETILVYNTIVCMGEQHKYLDAGVNSYSRYNASMYSFQL